MQLIAPDILAEARGLTDAMSGTLCLLGGALWLFGWRWHRFWIVASVTLGAGLGGLHAGRATGGPQILVVGVLLAMSAGMLALELARIFAFVAAGSAAWLAALWVFPQAHDLWAVFLLGGLVGLVLYRVWTMLLTSLVGVLLASHAALLLLEPLLKFDAVQWVNANQAAVNGGAIALALLGIPLQALVSRGHRDNAEEPAASPKPQKRPEPKPEPKVEARPFVGPPKPEPEPKHESEPHGSWWQRHLHLRKPT
jgi:hypothetical protein